MRNLNHYRQDIMDESELNEIYGGSDGIIEYLNDCCLGFLGEMGEAQFYFDTLIDFIESQEQKEIQRLEECANKLPVNRRGDYFGENYPFYWKSIFEENLKESFIISLFSVLEVYLERTCKILHNSKSKDLGKIKGNTKFDRYFKYIKQYVSAISTLDWITINNLWRIRCVITHNQGRCIEKSDLKRLSNYADKTGGISVRDGWIEIDPLFCKTTLTVIEEFGRELSQIISDDLAS